MMWMYDGKEFDPTLEDLDPKKVYGFVYLIESLVPDSPVRFYVGKKLFWFKGHKTVKLKNGKKKRQKCLVESDWREYYGSNKKLSEAVAKHGEENFRRTILHLCANKGTCSYLELKEQVQRNAIIDSTYYNDQIRARIHRSHLASLR